MGSEPLPTLTMKSPLFGPCRLIPHTMDEVPENVVAGYVALAGEKVAYEVAIMQNGEWRDRKLRRFTKPIVGWYSVEKADGSPLF